MDKSTLAADTSVRRFQLSKISDHAVTGGEELYSLTRQNSWIANCFLVRFFCKLLPNLLTETL